MDGSTVRKLLRCATTATLATHDVATGHPYASLVEVATMPDSRPVLLLSGLARHTRNLKSDGRASLLVDQRSEPAPLAAERAAIIGKLKATADPIARRRYLARYPEAEPWSGFGDFGFWVLDISLAHVIAGFGRIGEVPGEDVACSGEMVDRLADQEAELLASVN
ncbi:MAG: pyridoxamine 5'-phosphate oxidase family protein, partial [Proteobacteria bacterium]|nr:pyridoxamine 5'-phosphate oxidase family protein [Pseudomonadota bacterium]